MSVVIETTLGDITVDLFFKERPRACQNFLKLCKLKYYNFNLFHTVSRGFIAQTGDPTGSRNGGESIFGVLEGPLKRFFVAEANPRIKHTIMGLVSFVGNEENMIGSQFFFTLGEELMYLDGKHCVFGQVTEGFDVLELINEAICDSDDRPYQDIRITHTVVLDDPLPDIESMILPSRSPSPSAERLQGGRIAPDEEIDETKGKSMNEINELIAEREAKARANILEMVGDLPDAEMAPPENVLFVCKLNPVTTDDDLEIIFSRFGKIKSCEVIKDHKTGDSLQYAFVEFEEQKSCEDAYFKMDNVLIDDRRIHVDFSQSVSKLKWMGKGRGVRHLEEKINEKKSNVQDKRKRRNKSRSVSSSPERKSRANNYSLNSHKRKVHNDKGYQRNSNYKRGSWDLNEQSSSHQFKSKTEYEKVERRSRSTTPHIDRKRTKSSGKRDEKERSYSSTKSPEIDNNNKRKKEKSRLHQISSDEDQRNKQKRKDSIDKRDSKMKNRIKTKQRSSSSSLSSDSGEERKKYKTKDREKYSPSPGKISKSYRGKDTVKSKKRCSSRSVSSDRAEHRKNSYERNLEKSGDRSKISRETKKIKNSRSSSSSEEDIRTKKKYGDEKYGNEKKLSSFHKSKFKKSRLRTSSSRSSSPPKSRKHKRRRTRSTSPRKRK